MKAKVFKYSKELAAFAYVQEEYTKTGDIIAGIIPIFSPIIHECAGQVFNPTAFAEKVRLTYDIGMRPIVAEGLIPKLVDAGLLAESKPSEHVSIYRCVEGPKIQMSNTEQLVDDLLEEFCRFADEALRVHQIIISKEELWDGFLQRLLEMKFVHSSNGATESIKQADVENSSNEEPEASKKEQREMVLDVLSAEYIANLAEGNPARFEFMERMVAGALIADVVLTLQQPAADTRLNKLTVVIDSPLIMDALDLNTIEQAKYAQDLIDLLDKSKVKLIIFKHLIEEIKNNIRATLNAHLQGQHPYGPLANRFQSNPIHVTYARAVLDGTEDFISNLNITVEDADKFNSPEYLSYCPEEVLDSLRNCLNPLFDKVERRTRDATSVASVMRMRKGNRSQASVTESEYVMVTRNISVMASTNKCVIAKGLISVDDVPPCISDRQLACVLWLCLGGSDNKLTREKLLANCIDALYPRPNLLSTIRMFLEKIDTKKADIFEALMKDQRAQRCLIHKTHGDASMVSLDNVEELFEEVKRSTIKEFEQEAQQRESKMRAESEMKISAQKEELSLARSNADQLNRENAELLVQQDEFIQAALERACIVARKITRQRKAFVIFLYFISVLAVTYFSPTFDRLWLSILGALVACCGFWFVPEKIFKQWINAAGNNKFDEEIKAVKIKDYESRFEINRDSCNVHKR